MMSSISLSELLKKMIEMGGSDLHLSTNSAPRVRVNGNLRPLDMPPLTAADTKALAYSVLTDAQKHRLEENLGALVAELERTFVPEEPDTDAATERPYHPPLDHAHTWNVDRRQGGVAAHPRGRWQGVGERRKESLPHLGRRRDTGPRLVQAATERNPLGLVEETDQGFQLLAIFARQV